MPRLPHLALQRVDLEIPRKRRQGRPVVPERDYQEHGAALNDQVAGLLTQFRQRTTPPGIDPTLILRIQLDEPVKEEVWQQNSLTVLEIDENKTLVLFASDTELTDFKRRLSEYTRGPTRERQRNAPHNQLFASIHDVGQVENRDRIGRLFKFKGIDSPDQIEVNESYSVDVEIWDFGSRRLNQHKSDEVKSFVLTNGGVVTDEYNRGALVLLRVQGSGELIRSLLEIEPIRTVDLPPEPSLTRDHLSLGIEDFQEVPSPPDDAPAIAVLDTGVAVAHPFIAPALGEAISVPASIPDALDAHGHGTMVSGLALYGDVEECIDRRLFVPQLRLYSSRILNDAGRFDNDRLIASQMRDSIEYFRDTYGCRVFNLSLGDERQNYTDGLLSPWAATLDLLVRELQITIVVSAGNISKLPRDFYRTYPDYLLTGAYRLIEPATGAIVLTVGSLAHSASLSDASTRQSVALRPIALRDQPSPFTRVGPGINGSIKPELCEYGGNSAYDAIDRRDRRDIPELSVISFNKDYLERLFTTKAGTSFASPRVAFMAATLTGDFPAASANLIRALLVSSAKVPVNSENLLLPLDPEATLRVCGYGQPQLDAARYSDDNRVVLFAESTLGVDNFHIYEVPMPDEFVGAAGKKRISITLAFDPPVRHSRHDYLGTKMSFRLFRGRSLEDIVSASRLRTSSDEVVEALGGRFNCAMDPSPTKRENGTLQKATFTMQRRSDYGETYYLVVRCEKQRWTSIEHSPQKYGVVVVLEHSESINIYNRIRQRVSAVVRARG